jgi:DUF4097 and DUF4098 domain-containing protein YvlB
MEPNQESDRRVVWIYVAVALLLMFCCCALVTAAAAGSWVAGWPSGRSSERCCEETVDLGRGQERTDQTYQVGFEPSLTIDNFAGSINVRAGERGEIRVIATKEGTSSRDLERIMIEIEQRDGGLVIKTRKSQPLSNASVQFEITAPPDTNLDIHTGAGSADVRGFRSGLELDSGAGSLTVYDVAGNIDARSGAGSISMRGVSGKVYAHSGAGSIEVSDASGQMHLDTGTGSITYRGELWDNCRFESGAGGIELTLSTDLDMEVDLSTGAGTIEIGYAVDGKVGKREVKGTIGSGRDGSIYAHTGTGGIDLVTDQ